MEQIPSTPVRTRLTRDQRRDILLLRQIGKSYSEIALILTVTERAVQYTCNLQKATPQKQPGRPSKLSQEEVTELICFISAVDFDKASKKFNIAWNVNMLPPGEGWSGAAV